jgi:peptide/nickel transport system permease protein
VLSLLYTSSWSRYMRSTLIEVLSQDYIRTARAKGLSASTVVIRHGVRNALIPVVTVMCLHVPGLFTGAIITEAIFAWPGMGRLFYEGIQKGDYPRLMAILVISSALIVLFNLVADILYGILDPRIAYK